MLQAISALRATLSGMADDQGILGANGAPNLTPVNANAYTFPRSPAQVRGHVCTMFVRCPCSKLIEYFTTSAAFRHEALSCAMCRLHHLYWCGLIHADTSAAQYGHNKHRLLLQVLSVVTAGSANGTGLFFPNGLSGFTNASESNLLGRRRLLAAPQEEVYPVAAATSSRKLQQTNATSGVRSPPLT